MTDFLQVANKAIQPLVEMRVTCCLCNFFADYGGGTEAECIKDAIRAGWRKHTDKIRLTCPRCADAQLRVQAAAEKAALSGKDKDKRALNNALMAMGCGGLNDRNLYAQMAMLVRSHKHFREVLKAANPAERRQAYDALAPRLMFKAKSIDVYLGAESLDDTPEIIIPNA